MLLAEAVGTCLAGIPWVTASREPTCLCAQMQISYDAPLLGLTNIRRAWLNPQPQSEGTMAACL